MFESKEEMDAIVRQAKDKLSKQQKDNKDAEEVVDYSTFFEEDNTLEKPVVSEENSSYESADVDVQDTVMPNISNGHDLEYDRVEKLEQRDTPLYEGGPGVGEVKAWKKQYEGYDIFVVEILDETFICRTLNRFEYKQLLLLHDSDALQREEIICNTVTLFPDNLNWGELASLKAGVPSTLSEIVMEKSGFTKDFGVRII